jgi:uncharacterized protein
MRCGWLFGLTGWLATVAAGPAQSQTIECAKARPGIERAVCASSDLLAQDRLLAEAYAEALAREPSHADAIRQAQRQWLNERTGACTAAPAKDLQNCLARSYRSRLSALSGTPTVVVAQADLTGVEAKIEHDRFATAGEHATLLRVLRPGRFAIKAESPTGTALQLVDMLTGPSDLTGDPGSSDGRLAPLLDVGTYKLRLFGAPGAQGETRLSATPFREVRAPAAAPALGEVASDELGDLQQRSFWLSVGTPGHVRIEAAGRALRDLRLWRAGTDLVPIDAETRTIEPTRGHPLTDFLMAGTVEPGAYLVTAYGGTALPWADGATSQPFHLRVGTAAGLVDGWVRGRVGPFGSEVYEVGLQVTTIRLDLPDPAPAVLSVGNDNGELGHAAIAKDSREPNAIVRVAAGTGEKRLVEVTGTDGQEFQVRSFQLSQTRTLSSPGDWWVSAETLGMGGDELPATFLLVRRDARQGVFLVASAAPRVGPGQAWRRRFNLRGPSSVLFQVTQPGPIAVRTDGVALEPAIDSQGGQQITRRSNSTASYEWDLASGWYLLRLKPIGSGSGELDLTIGPPRLIPDQPSPPQPASPVIPFGRQTIASGESLTLDSGGGPGVLVALSGRTLPVDLEAAPLTATVEPGHSFEVPVRFPATGNLVATEIGEGAAAVELLDPRQDATNREGMARVGAADRARTVILAWHPAVAATVPPATAAPAALAGLEAGRPSFFDLAKGEKRNFGMNVGVGGLYRVETLGRLRTEGWIGTPFIAELGHETANGHGQNMLLQRYLRAGHYRVTVAADDSAGRVGLVARPAPLIDGATLTPGGSVRASMPAGSGAAFPVEIAEAGNYHLDLVGLGRKFTARLEDEEGWPILPAGDLTSLDRALSPGRYRLMVLPAAVDARVVARLSHLQPEATLQGHGPHPLLFDAEQRFQWREPPGRDDPRLPDQWDFTLAGPAHVTVDISDGMVADVRKRDGPILARLMYKSGFEGDLPAGDYRVEATSLGRNDRLDYTLSLRSRELQPDRPRTITLPATVPFAIDRDRVASLTSFGNVALKAVLRDGDGRPVGRFDGRTDDWNIAVSRYLPAGHYTLDLSSVAPSRSTPSEPAQNEKEDNDSGDNEQPAAEGDEQPAPEPEKQAQQAEAAETAEPQFELRLALPGEAAAVMADATATVRLEGAEVHRLSLPLAEPGRLLVAAATSSAELVLALERSNPDGSWRTVALDQGRAPIVAAPSDADSARPWRVSGWTVDGGSEPVQFAIRSLSADAQPVGLVNLAPLALDETFGTFRTALVAAPQAGLIRLDQDTAPILTGSAAGQALSPIEGGIIVPQSDRVWLLSRGSAAAEVALAVLAPAPDQAIALNLPPGGAAMVPATPVGEGRLRFWLAESGFGQPAPAAAWVWHVGAPSRSPVRPP